MSSSQLSAEEIFHAVQAIDDPGQQDDYLRHACGDNRELLIRLRRMLQAQQDTDSLLDDGMAETCPPDLTRHDPARQQIGPYKLLQPLGEGGFGTVYMAEQTEPVRRKVAVKLIKPGMDSKEIITRFEAERQALAIMDHPNIARVLDAGKTDRGRPFFVMELVRGVNIVEYADKNNLTTPQRLELLVDVCRAVQHAHQKGVIHRDIKPSNVMVTLQDGRPVPKVIDFGVAKAISQPLTDKTMFTRYGQVIGTPLYMSPEQAEMSGLDIDTRSDIYSLGVILYELLAGRTPFSLEVFRKAGFDEMRRMIREEDPVVPSQVIRTLDADTATAVAKHRSSKPDALSRLFHGELDWIVMKALEKDRERRYETAKGFASDIERYLQNEPVSAGPPSNIYRLVKFVKRNKQSVVAAGLLAVMFIAGFVGTLSGWYRANSEAEEKGQALERARASEREAEKQRDNVQIAADAQAKLLYRESMNSAMTAWRKNDTLQLRRILNKYRDQYGDQWEHRYLSGLAESSQSHSLITSDVNAMKLTAIPGSKRFIASHARESIISLIDPVASSVQSVGELSPGTWAFTFAAVTPDGSQVLHPTEDFSSIVIRNLPSLDESAKFMIPVEFSKDAYRVSAACFHPDGITVALAIPTAGIVLFDTSANRFGELIRLDGIGKNASIASSPNGREIAVASGKLYLIDAETGETIHSLRGHSSALTSVVFVDKGHSIVSGSRDRTAIVWDCETGRHLRTIGPFDGEVRAVAYDESKQLLAIGSRNRKLTCFSLPEFSEVKEIRSFDGLYGVTFSDTGDLMYGVFGGGVAVADLRSNETRDRFYVGGTVLDLMFSPDGSRLYYLTERGDGANPEWGYKRLEFVAARGRYESQQVFENQTFNFAAFDTTIFSGKDAIATCESESGRLVIASESNGDWQIIAETSHPQFKKASVIRLSADDNEVFVGTESGEIWSWRWRETQIQPARIPYRHDHRVTAIAAFKQGCISGDGNGRVVVWPGGSEISTRDFLASTGTWIRGLDVHRNVYSFGLFGSTANGKRVFMVDTSGTTRGFYGHTFSIQATGFMEQGRTLITLGGDREIKLWTTDNFDLKLAIREDEILQDFAISPDETMIAAGTREGSIFIYEAPKRDRNASGSKE